MKEDVEKRWFAARLDRGHQGGGKFIDDIVFLYAQDALRAHDIVKKKVRGFKKKRIDVRPLSDEAVEELLKRIRQNTRVSIGQVMRDGFFYKNALYNQ